MAPDVHFSKEFPFFKHENRVFLESKLNETLALLGKSKYFNNLSYILNEIVGNSDKANLKRALFIKENLDIHNPHDYRLGISKLKESIQNNLEELLGIIEEKHFFIKVDFVLRNGVGFISVTNNNELLPIEKERIDQRFIIAQKYRSIDEVLAESFDQTEGGGFGLIMSILMLRKLGADEKSIRFFVDNDLTVVNLEIPLDLGEEIEEVEEALEELEDIEEL